jgi:hypothetical protein
VLSGLVHRVGQGRQQGEDDYHGRYAQAAISAARPRPAPLGCAISCTVGPSSPDPASRPEPVSPGSPAHSGPYPAASPRRAHHPVRVIPRSADPVTRKLQPGPPLRAQPHRLAPLLLGRLGANDHRHWARPGQPPFIDPALVQQDISALEAVITRVNSYPSKAIAHRDDDVRRRVRAAPPPSPGPSSTPLLTPWGPSTRSTTGHATPENHSGASRP